MSFKDKRKLKVFHGLVNYGTQAGLFAHELRNQGVDSISVSYPDRFKRQIDVELLHGGNFFEKIIKHTWNYLRRLYWFFRYNIFHFYYGTSLFPNQWDLPLYRLFGKKIILHYLGNDVQLYEKSVKKYKWTNMPGFIEDKDPIAYDRRILNRMKYEVKYANLQCVCAPCYSEFVPNSIVIPLAIDLELFSYNTYPENTKTVIMHAPTSRGFKGTDYIVKAIDKLKVEGFDICFNLVENITHAELKEEYKKCDIFIDQIMGGWYGTAAIEAMAIGRPVICSLRKSYFEYIEFGEKIPIIHADPDCIYESIKHLLVNKSRLPQIGIDSRKFVEEIHDCRKIAENLIEIYKRIY
jgi:glycosyltransferase involved in cell wall biosynthesis